MVRKLIINLAFNQKSSYICVMNIATLKIGDHFKYLGIEYIYAGSKNGIYFAYHAIIKKVEFLENILVEV